MDRAHAVGVAAKRGIRQLHLEASVKRGEFFKGWRRKGGLVMLVLAMFVTFGWMRSNIIQDAIFVRQHQSW